MELIDDISVFFHIASLCMSLLLAAIVIRKQSYYKASNRHLLLLLLGAVICHGNAVIVLSGYKALHFYSRVFNNTMTLLVGPAIYLAVLLRLQPQKKWSEQWIHFIPFVLFLLLTIICYSNLIDDPVLRRRLDATGFTAYLIQFPIYILLTYRQSISQANTAIQNLRVLLVGLLVTYLVQVLAFVYDPFVQYLPRHYPAYLLLIYALFLIAFVYRSLINNNLLFERPKYLASSLTKQQTSEILGGIADLMEREQLFLNPNLKINDLAKSMKITSKYISQAINDSLDKNFYDLVNEYRIKYVTQLIEDPANQQFTLMALAQKAGFKSSSVFNAAFKKNVGMLPSQYRKQVRSGW